MYRQSGIDRTYWMAFRAKPEELHEFERSLQMAGYRRTEGKAGQPPRIPPEAIRSWWVPPGTSGVVWKAGTDMRGEWVFVETHTGQVWVCTFTW